MGDEEGKAEMAFLRGKKMERWPSGCIKQASNQHLPPREPSPKEPFFAAALRLGSCYWLDRAARGGQVTTHEGHFTARLQPSGGRWLGLSVVNKVITGLLGKSGWERLHGRAMDRRGLDFEVLVRSGSLIRPSKLHIKRRQHAYDMANLLAFSSANLIASGALKLLRISPLASQRARGHWYYTCMRTALRGRADERKIECSAD